MIDVSSDVCSSDLTATTYPIMPITPKIRPVNLRTYAKTVGSRWSRWGRKGFRKIRPLSTVYGWSKPVITCASSSTAGKSSTGWMTGKCWGPPLGWVRSGSARCSGPISATGISTFGVSPIKMKDNMIHKQLAKLFGAVATLACIQCGATHTSQTPPPATVYSWYLTDAVPSGGITAQFNTPILRWPAERGSGAHYDVRLSQDSLFGKTQTLHREKIPWAMFNPHQHLPEGKWYWQYRVSGKAWSELQTFLVTSAAIPLVSPAVTQFINGIPAHHPRVLPSAADPLHLLPLTVDQETRAITHTLD